MNTVLTRSKVITRKPHQCFSCLESFPAGTEMKYCSCVYEGELCSSYTCATCEEIMALCKDDSDGGFFPEGFVSEMLKEGQTPQQCLERIKERRKQ